MARDIPGYYYDPEKNRYFPTRGPIPGASRNNSSCVSSSGRGESSTSTLKESQACCGKNFKINRMLHARELCGTSLSLRKRKVNFQEQCKKMRATNPMIWKYNGTERISGGALEQMHVIMDTLDGESGTDVLLTSSSSGALCVYEVGKVRQYSNFEVQCKPDCVWPLNLGKETTSRKTPLNLWRLSERLFQMPSNISCIKKLAQHPQTAESTSSMQQALVTTLGSEAGGFVYLMDLTDDPSSFILHEMSMFDSTVWTADIGPNGSRAVIGTNSGAALLDIETGRKSFVLRCKSDVLSLQFHSSENIVLCGLRNGAIVSLDARQKPELLTSRLISHQVPYPPWKISKPLRQRGRSVTKRSFELKSNMHSCPTIFMPSSISCLKSLTLNDQHFLASCMEGTMNLYDIRLTQKGPVQSYEGNVNSHTRLELGVDPFERFVLSGGEDCYLRLWSIKSGEMLFEEKFMTSIPTVMCLSRANPAGLNPLKTYNGDVVDSHCPNGWFGSEEGLFYMQYS